MTTEELTKGNQIEQALNLRSQIQGLNEELEDQDFIFRDTSPPARWETVYATDTGKPERVKRKRLPSVLEKTRPDGKPAFTTFKNQVPTWTLGTTLCIFAEGSAEWDVIKELGLTNPVCPARHLPHEGVKDRHAKLKHPTRYETYKAWLDRKERDELRDEQRRQTEAILALAGQRGIAVAERPAKVVEPQTEIDPCPDCGFVAKNAFGLQAHVRNKHKESG